MSPNSCVGPGTKKMTLQLTNKKNMHCRSTKKENTCTPLRDCHGPKLNGVENKHITRNGWWADDCLPPLPTPKKKKMKIEQTRGSWVFEKNLIWGKLNMSFAQKLDNCPKKKSFYHKNSYNGGKNTIWCLNICNAVVISTQKFFRGNKLVLFVGGKYDFVWLRKW